MAIVCHKWRFIFIKTRKTAGSSVEIALSRVCSAEDFITPLDYRGGSDEQLRRESGGHPPVNWRKPWWRYRPGKELRHRIKYGLRAPILGSHATARQLRRHFGEEVWSSYFRFTIERNPWDRAVSRYWWMKHRREKRGRTDFPSISDFLAHAARERPHWLTNWDHYTIDDRIAVDKVMFYESLEQEMRTLEVDFQLPERTLALPEKRAKGGLRKDARHYSEVLSDDDRRLVARVCHKEIEAFGYTFEARSSPRVS